METALSSIGHTDELRIDPHYFELVAHVSTLKDHLISAHPIAEPFFSYIRNGENLPAIAYIRDGEPTDILYASVGALSQFALRLDACIPLKSLEGNAVQRMKTNRAEVLLTRSGTPGIAWSMDLPPENAYSIIPSGFLIRIGCNHEYFIPSYVTAILNHPLWRLWTSAFAAGKRQRNLSQEHLSQIFIPNAPAGIQSVVGTRYAEALRDVLRILDEPENILGLCNKILNKIAGLEMPEHLRSMNLVERAHLRDTCESNFLRIDHRFLRSDYRAISRYIQSQPHRRLADCLCGSLIRNSQPEIEVLDFGGGPRVIATGSLQSGQVIEALTKPTSTEYFETVRNRAVHKHDVLVAMDGDGSIGKAAIMQEDYHAICDSHVAILRTENRSRALALCCYINSSWAQAQIGRMISGSTGQIQLSGDDLTALPIQSLVLACEYRIAHA